MTRKIPSALYYVGILLAATFIVVASARDLGWFGLSIVSPVAANAMSIQVGTKLCGDIATAHTNVGRVDHVQVLAGVRESTGESTDTLICFFTTGMTIPYMLSYSTTGELTGVQ